VRAWDELAQIDKHGYMDRKQELQIGGKRSAIRSWKTYYTILCGQLVCFFKVGLNQFRNFVKPQYLQDEEAFMENNAASPPVYILNAACVEQKDYVKRKHVFKLATTVFLYLC
jgi:spectrin beta